MVLRLGEEERWDLVSRLQGVVLMSRGVFVTGLLHSRQSYTFWDKRLKLYGVSVDFLLCRQNEMDLTCRFPSSTSQQLFG